MLYDSKFNDSKGKLRTRSIGTYQIYTYYANGLV